MGPWTRSAGSIVTAIAAIVCGFAVLQASAAEEAAVAAEAGGGPSLAELQEKLVDLEKQRRGAADHARKLSKETEDARVKALTENEEIKVVYEQLRELNRKLAEMLKNDPEFSRLSGERSKATSSVMALSRDVSATKRKIRERQKAAKKPQEAEKTK